MSHFTIEYISCTVFFPARLARDFPLPPSLHGPVFFFAPALGTDPSAAASSYDEHHRDGHSSFLSIMRIIMFHNVSRTKPFGASFPAFYPTPVLARTNRPHRALKGFPFDPQLKNLYSFSSLFFFVWVYFTWRLSIKLLPLFFPSLGCLLFESTYLFYELLPAGKILSFLFNDVNSLPCLHLCSTFLPVAHKGRHLISLVPRLFVFSRGRQKKTFPVSRRLFARLKSAGDSRFFCNC